MIAALLKRWRASGGSAYDPLPTLAHHLVHILFGISFSLFCLYVLKIQWFIVAITGTSIPAIAEYIQYRNGATDSDCVFDAYQYQTHWFFYFNPFVGLTALFFWMFGYIIMMFNFVNEDGDPVQWKKRS